MESKLFGWFEEMLGGVALLSCSVYLFIWSGAQLGACLQIPVCG